MVPVHLIVGIGIRAANLGNPLHTRRNNQETAPAMIEFFDRAGREAAFCHDGHSIYLWNGKPAAFIHDDKVYAYGGRFIGWADRGWISDESGECLLFERDAVGGPQKPSRLTKTTPGPRGAKPQRGERLPTPTGQANLTTWSEYVFSDLI
jgi:hypothetical protein